MTIYLIEKFYHSRDRDNYPTAHGMIQDQYGYFTNWEAAEALRASLEAEEKAKYDAEVETAMDKYRKALAAHEKSKAELAALKETGEKTTLKALPRPYKPYFYGAWNKQDEYISYELLDFEPADGEA